MSERHQFITIKIPYQYNDEDRALLGDEIVKFIQQRTEKGISATGKKFQGYSATYVKSLDFKNAGKSKSHVNLRLSGDMMGMLSVLNHGVGYISLGYEAGSEENDKAAWQQMNTKPGFPVREFLGIEDKDLQAILDKNPPTDQQTYEQQYQQQVATEAKKGIPSVVESIFKRWGLDTSEADNGE